MYQLTCTDVRGLDVLDLGICQYQGVVRGDEERMRKWGGHIGRTWSLNIRPAMSGLCRWKPFKIETPPNLLGDLAFQSSFAQGILYLEVL